MNAAGPSPLLILLGALLLVAPTAAQLDDEPISTDPRDSRDPRIVERDPRAEPDPRKEDVDAQEEEHPERLSGGRLFAALAEAGDRKGLIRALAEAPWEVQPHIIDELRRWHTLTPGGLPHDDVAAVEAAALQERVREVARAADEALADTRFEALVDHHFAWTPEERAQFDAGQALIDEAWLRVAQAETSDALGDALTPLQQALERLRPLGDVASEARILLLIGRIQSADRSRGIDVATLQDALRLGREVRDLDAVWTPLTLIYEAHFLANRFEPAEEILVEQLEIAREMQDAKTAEQVMDRMIDLDLARRQAAFQ